LTPTRQPLAREKLDDQGVDPTGRVAAGAEAAKPAIPECIEQAFGDDAAGRVAGAQEQNVDDVAH
jgi:hypothetical protein